MRSIVLLSYTGLNESGGVPRWNRDFVAGFKDRVVKHFSWEYVRNFFSISSQQLEYLPEWEKANVLNNFLISHKQVSKDDIIISDGFWGEHLSSCGYNVISVAHGIWSHLTKEDVDAGKQPDFPVHHQVQVNHRRSHLSRGGKIVAVSDFIADQMKLQWGFESAVINNAIDLNIYKPSSLRPPWSLPEPIKYPSKTEGNRLIIHGVTNANKGFEHIKAVKDALPNDKVLLLDEAAEHFKCDKYDALARADLVVQPSAYEGNSYFVLETLASDVPIVAYKVGLLHAISDIAKKNNVQACIGAVIERKYRSPEETAKVAKFILDSVSRERSVYNPRQVASLFSIQNFHKQWREYLDNYERNLTSR